MTQSQLRTISTGDEGLDHVLAGGLPRNAVYLLQGIPGSGKTTLALQLLLAAARRGERGMYVALSETREEINRVASSHGWSLDPIEVLDLASFSGVAQPLARQTMFQPADVEMEEVIRPILEAVERLNPAHVVIDSLSEIRLLSGELLRFRRQVLALKQFFAKRDCTVLLLDDRTADAGPLLESLAHGVVTLTKDSPQYGRTRRRLSVEKLRGVAFREGFHDFRINTGHFVVYPRLVAADNVERAPLEPLPSGIAGLDALLGGGPHRGTNTLLMGPAGAGKSTLTMQYAVAAAQRGERSALFAFDETLGTMLARTRSLGIPFEQYLDAGLISVRRVDPAELSAGEFSHAVREAVVRDGAKLVVIDSVNGLIDSLPDEQFLRMHLRELLTFLNQGGVATLTVLAQHGLLGDSARLPLDVSFLADNILLFRYFEALGEVRQAVSVFKKRSGPHERSIREFSLGPGGIRVGEAIREFQGVLTGVPSFTARGGLAGERG